VREGGTSGGLSCAEVGRGGAGREDDARDQLEICRIATTTTTREYLEWTSIYKTIRMLQR
jgi:hypothetical protein